MARTVAEWLADPTARTLYLVFALAVLVLPLIALSAWYHGSIRKSRGGRQLMAEQEANPPIAHGPFVLRNVKMAMRLMRGIGSGAYGAKARRMQERVYWIVGLWLVANTLVFGLLIWADAMNAGGAMRP